MQEKQQEKSPIKQKILLYLTQRGVTPYEFYKISGVTRGILQQNNGISEENIARFLAYAPEVNIEWLMTGRGEMLADGAHSGCPEAEKTVPATNDAADGRPAAIVSHDPAIGSPYYDVDFIGGFDEVVNSQVAVPASNIIIRGFEKAQLWCNVTGHSMEPEINHGDIIGLHECRVEDIQYGEIYAVALDTLRTIKILRKSPDPRALRYAPVNTAAYDEQDFPVSRIIKVYEVVGSVKKFF